MGLSLRNGDYVPDGTGGLRRTEGREALLEQVLFRLTARRGTFPFLPELGSRLWQLGQLARSALQTVCALPCRRNSLRPAGHLHSPLPWPTLA